MSTSLKREIKGSNFEPVKSNTILQRARHCCDISSKRAVLPADATTQRWAPQTRNTLWCKVGITRPGFLLNFLSSTVWNVAQVHDSLFRAPVVNYTEQPVCEWKSVSRKSFWVLSGEIEPSSNLPATFLKVAVLNEDTVTKFLAVPLKILSRRIQKNAADVNAKNECVTIIKQKCYKKFYLICFNWQWRILILCLLFSHISSKT